MKIVKSNIVILSSDALCATLFFLASALLLSTSASAQGYRVDGVTQARSGFPAAAVTIAVCVEPATVTTTPCSALATLYTDSTLATPCTGTLQPPPATSGGAASSCSNPLVADGLGNYHYYVANGRYALQFYGSGITAYAQRDQVYPCAPVSGSCSFLTITLGGTIILSKSVASCCSGFLEVNTGALFNSSVQVNSGSFVLNQNASYVQFRNGNPSLSTGHRAFLQAGDSTSGNPIWAADNTFTFPDLAQGGAVAASGYLLGATVAELTAASGNCMFASNGGGPAAGYMNNSGFGCNTNILFPVKTRQVAWLDGSNAMSLFSESLSANRSATLPDASGRIALDPSSSYNANTNAFTGVFACTNVTPVTVNTSTTADQNVMACTIPAGVLNRVNRTLRVAASGIYSTPAASTAQMTVKIKLCTVSGCGSGTVITPISIQSTALGTVQITNDNWSVNALSTTQTAGASSAYEAHGDFLIDLSTLTTAADSAFGDTNTATVGTIDSTAQLFLQCTFAFSAASASNSATQRQLVVETIN